MDWKDVGDWLQKNAGTGAALVGSLLVGNVPGAVAAGVSLVASASGHATPDAALAASRATRQRSSSCASWRTRTMRTSARTSPR
jgi:hypothetical protein